MYEKDFIDDSDMLYTTTPTKPNRKKGNRSSKMKSFSSSSSSESDATKYAPKKLILSSDEEITKNQGQKNNNRNETLAASDCEDEVRVHVKRRTRKRHSSYCAQLTSSSEDEAEKEMASEKRRKVKWLESDEEIM